MQTVQHAPLDAGTSHTFHASPKLVLKAVRESIPEVGLALKSERTDDTETMFLAERGVTAFSWGEEVRIVVHPDASSVNVRIISERAFAPNITAKDFDNDLFTLITNKLNTHK